MLIVWWYVIYGCLLWMVWFNGCNSSNVYLSSRILLMISMRLLWVVFWKIKVNISVLIGMIELLIVVNVVMIWFSNLVGMVCCK